MARSAASLTNPPHIYVQQRKLFQIQYFALTVWTYDAIAFGL